MTNPMIKKIALALMGTTVLVPAVVAQESADAQITSVYDRYREDFSAMGVRSGSFLFYPKITTDARFDSNIYKTDEANTPNVDDFIAIIKPQFDLQSNWNNHFFGLSANAKIGRYMDQGAEDYEDFRISANGRYDISRGTNVSFNASYDSAHEDRGSPDNVGGANSEYTKYGFLTVGAGFKRDEGLISFAADAKLVDKNFDDAVVGNNVINNDDRDRKEYSESVRVGYHLNEEYEAFVKLTAVQVEYDDRRDDNGVIHDSDGWNVVGGLAFNLGGKSEGEVYAGYVKRDFDSASLGDVDDFKFGASVLWAPSGLTTVRLSVDRNVTETTVRRQIQGTQVAASGILSTLYAVRVEHELQRNFLLNASASFNEMDYVGMLRQDELYKAGMGAQYFFNRNLALNVDYKFDKRTAFRARANSDYDMHAFIVSLRAQW